MFQKLSVVLLTVLLSVSAQAQTKKKSKIKRGLETLYIKEKNISDGITLDREIFHECLLHEIE